MNSLTKASILMTLFFQAPVSETILKEPFTYNLKKGIIETGVSRFTEKGLELDQSSTLLLKHPKVYGLSNGHLKVSFIPPLISSAATIANTPSKNCFCAFKVHIGLTVIEVSDESVHVVVQNRTNLNKDSLLVSSSRHFLHDGTQKDLDIFIEDRVAHVKINNELITSCEVSDYDFAMVRIGTFAHTFTVTSVQLFPLLKEPFVIDKNNNSLLLDALYLPSRFNQKNGLANHHFVTWEGGKASGLALIVTSASDSAIHDALVKLGAQPGNNLTVESWTKRLDSKSREPDKYAQGTDLTLSVLYGGKEFTAADILKDMQGKAYNLKFAGNKALINHWKSGCVVCLQSCPGSKVANSTYTMRDLAKNGISFQPQTSLPFKEGDHITLKLQISQ